MSRDSQPFPNREPIAIVGMACRFPGAPDIAAFWRLLMEGRNAVSEYIERRGPALDSVMTPSAQQSGRIASLRGGFLPGIDRFDAGFFGISPREAVCLDPQQRLLLELSWEALEDAGAVAERIRGSRAGVFIGMWTSDYEANLYETLDDVEFYTTTGGGRYAAPGRIAYHFDFRGPALTVDTACSSSLVALHLACRSLLNGESDMALAGACNLIMRPEVTLAYSRAKMLSSEGNCKFADEAADGYVRSEGGAILVLKRLSSALADGDEIHAVILGGAVTSHGGSSGLLIRPGQPGLETMLREAWTDAGVSAGEVDYIEAHGPGTPAGDPVELGAINQVLSAEGRKDTCLVGSVKTNIGHLEATSGLAGVIKTVLALKHRTIPPTLHFRTPHPAIDWSQALVRVPTEATAWPRSSGQPIAGVSAFGITGTVAHVVLGESPVPPRSSRLNPVRRSAQLLPLSAHTPAAVEQLAKAYLDDILTAGCDLRDVCYTASVRRTHHEYRTTFVAADVAGMRRELEAFLAGEESPARSSGRSEAQGGRLAFIFPGQGSQWIGMGCELLRTERVFREALERCGDSIRKFGGWSVIALLNGEDAAEIDRIDRVQPLLFAIQVALGELWRSWGVAPDAVAGHSMGEAAAAVIAGALSVDEGARIICTRSRRMREVEGKGGMAVLGVPVEHAARLLAPYGNRLSIAASNSALSTVVSGDLDAIEDLLRSLEHTEVFSRAIRVDVASHSAHVDPIIAAVKAELTPLESQPSVIEMYSTVTGAREQGPLGPEYWAQNLRQPVLFLKAIEAMTAAGCRFFLEMSSHPLLVAAVEETIQLSSQPTVAAGSLRRDEPEAEQLMKSLGRLHTAGYPVDWAKFYEGAGRSVRLPLYPWQRESFWFDTASAAGAVKRRASGAAATALADHIQVAAKPGLHVWRIDVSALPFAADSFRVNGVPALPLSACFQLILEAAASLVGVGPAALENIFLSGNISLGGSPEIQLSMEALDPLSATFHLQGSAGADGGSVLRGIVRRDETAPPGAISPQPVEQAGSSSFYEDAAERGLEYSSRIQVLDSVVEGIQQSVAAAHIDGTPWTALEAMLQLVVSAAGKTFHPHSIGRIRLSSGSSNETVLVKSSAVSADPVTADAWTADVEIRSATGSWVAEMRNVELRLVEEGHGHTAAEHLYEEEWVSLPLPLPAALPARDWVIIDDGSAFGRKLARRMETRGGRVSVVSSPEDVPWSAAIAGVLVLNEPAGSEEVPAAAPAEISIARVSLVTRVAQALSQARPGDSPRLWIITRGVERIPGGRPVSPNLEHAALRGLGRVILQELPELRCTNLDLSPSPDTAEIDSALNSIVGDDSEDLMAFRESRRYVARLRRLPAGEGVFQWPVRKHAGYLVTGGLGGLGLLMAASLSAAGATHVILAGRSAPRPAALEAIRAMELNGTRVTVHRCDIAEREQVSGLLDSISGQGVPLAGIIYAAAITDDALVRDLTSDSIARVFAPKALGAWHLHELTAAAPLDFFVLFSSIAAVLPQPGHGSYAAANAFLDGLAGLRLSQGRPAVSLQWAAWTATGIWTAGMKRTVAGYRRQGIGRISARTGAECLLRSLHSSAAHLLVAPVDWAKVSEFYGGAAAPSLLRELAIPFVAAASPGRRGDAPGILDRLRNSWPEAGEMLDVHLRQTLGMVLKISADRIDSSRPLGLLGLDSLMGLEFVRRLGAGLGLRLPASLVYNYPTIARMTGHLLLKLEPPREAAVQEETPEQARIPENELADLSEAEVLAELLRGH